MTGKKAFGKDLSDGDVPVLPMLPTIRRVIREFLTPYLRPFFLAVAAMFVTAVSTAGFAFMTREVVNKVFVANDSQIVWLVAGALFLFSVAKGLGNYFQIALLSKVERGIVSDLEERLFADVIRRRTGYFTGKSPAQHISILKFYAGATARLIMTAVTALARDLITLAALAVVMVTQEPLMSAFSLIAVPVVMLGLAGIGKKVKQAAQIERKLLTRVVSISTEAFGGIRVVKSFQLEGVMIARAADAIRRMQEQVNKLRRISAIASPLMEATGGFVIAAFVVYASWQSLENGKSPGEFVAFITAFLFAYEPAKKLANVNVTLTKELVAVSQMYALLDNPDPDIGDEILPDLVTGDGEVRFDHVSFGFGDELPVLQDVSFHVSNGERVALVGRSGSGKSTIVNLILQLLRSDEGTISIGNQDITRVSTTSIRQNIGFVGQQTFLFQGSVRDNILYGRMDAGEAAVVAAAKAASAHEFIMALPQGYDTEIGADGDFLSGGQRQRVAIARAIVKDAPILLMDEATSALDGESEQAILSALRNLMRGRTSITVAHRLSTIMSSDRIILLDAGRIVATGTHAELSASCELYQTLFLSDATEDPDL